MSRWEKIRAAFVGVAIGLVALGFVTLYNEASDSPDDARRVLCIGIMANEANTARDEPLVIELCEDVGIHRSDY